MGSKCLKENHILTVNRRRWPIVGTAMPLLPGRHLLLLLLLSTSASAATVAAQFPPPDGFVRATVDDKVGSFGAFLQGLPLLPPGTPVRAFHGGTVAAPWARAVVDLDVGASDLQQCADSAIRLYAEYQRSRGTTQTLSFHATSGDPIPWSRYRAGERAVARGNKLVWQTRGDAVDGAVDDARRWRSWLETVFMYAGSMSLAKDTVPVTGEVRPGDLLVVGGSPGHVLVVLDTAVHRDEPGRVQWLLGQGFMPAQSFHVLGWYAPDKDGAIRVPSWPKPFEPGSRRRFR